MKPTVSVCIPTYNHEAFVARALDGALMQQTDFAVEIVIGDDGSTDGAAAIIQTYAERFPDRIRAFLHPHNLGPAHPREFAGRTNVLSLFAACEGEFIALCEGDDYWTDPLKLQKQVDFLRKNPVYSLCHHNVRVIYEDGSPGHLFNPTDQAETSTVEAMLADNWIVATASALYRNYFRHEPFADWHAEAASGDWALLIQVAVRGNIGYLNEIMGVYRRHRGGLSNVHAPHNRVFLENRRAMFANVNQWLDYQYDETVQRTLKKYDELLEML